MLNQHQMALVKSTAPVLQRQGEALTRHFYQRMFARNPEVLPYFNQANQVSGDQQKALATAITRYAANIDKLESMQASVELIAQKHVSLRILPEHYPIVGENLLSSIKEVLGDAASDDIIDAWREAYGLLAQVLIGREEEIYTQQENTEGGWRDFKPFRIARKVAESDVITSFYLHPEDGSEPPQYKPGQYITVKVPTSDDMTTMRNYSLSDRPDNSYLRISVKREDAPISSAPHGYVSHLLHHHYQQGDILQLAPPSGEFTLCTECDKPLVLLAGGVGITPIMSMLKAALANSKQRDIVLVHANRNARFHAFREEVIALRASYPNLSVHFRYSDPDESDISQQTPLRSFGIVDEAWLSETLEIKDADYYFCGPKPFMLGIDKILKGWNVPQHHINFEFFGPQTPLDAT